MSSELYLAVNLLYSKADVVLYKALSLIYYLLGAGRRRGGASIIFSSGNDKTAANLKSIILALYSGGRKNNK
ncbi:MAG: hypothetical protein GX834_00950 [Clostridiaceae bacterium]|nr:hypothetical protein [Clostridiaceae bacterium]